MSIDFDRIKKNKKDKIVSDLNDYIDSILLENKRLQDRLREYSKEKEIVKMKKELEDIRAKSLHEMSDNEVIDAKKFRNEHWKACGGNIEYILFGTGIGTSLNVRCRECGETKSITDFSNW